MALVSQPFTITRAGAPAETLPRCSGVYRFFDAQGGLLYIGKSVDIHSRVTQHINEGRKPGRHQRLMSQVRRVDCQMTAGEVGALLIENEAIKREVPLYNRRQRRLRRLWTMTLTPSSEGFLQPTAIDFLPVATRKIETFGLYANKGQVISSLQNLARDHALCLRVMGLDRGHGPCFQHQLGRCDGACAGEESKSQHNARLLDQLARQRIAAWPFDGPLLLAEHTIKPIEQQPEQQFHLIDQWAWYGYFDTVTAARNALSTNQTPAFDRDAYRLIYSAIYRGRVHLQNVITGQPVVNVLLSRKPGTS